MMDRTEMTDELIMAYADGELGEREARQVELAAAADPEVQRKLNRFTETAQRLRTAANDLPPVSDDLAQRVARMLDEDGQQNEAGVEENVIAFKPKTWARYWPSAIAASITLAVGLAAGVALAPSGNAPVDAPIGVAALADPEIANVLSTLESGGSTVLASGATLNVIASFMDADSVLCREFDYETTNGQSVVSVACQEGADWHPRIAIASSAETPGTYAPASSLDALEAWLSSSGLSHPLSKEDERKVLHALASEM
jgi:hypothetical protein